MLHISPPRYFFLHPWEGGGHIYICNDYSSHLLDIRLFPPLFWKTFSFCAFPARDTMSECQGVYWQSRDIRLATLYMLLSLPRNCDGTRLEIQFRDIHTYLLILICPIIKIKFGYYPITCQLIFMWNFLDKFESYFKGPLYWNLLIRFLW